MKQSGVLSLLALLFLLESESSRWVFLCLTQKLAVPSAAVLPEEGLNNPAFRQRVL